MKNLVWLIVFALLFTACGPTVAATQQGFLSVDGWQLSVDQSVGCEGFLPKQEDIGLVSVDGVLVLQANRLLKPGMFVNAIASRPFEYQGSGQYILRGKLAIPAGRQLEMANMALEFVVDGVGHYAEIIWGLNEYDPRFYGLIYTRTTDWAIPPAYVFPSLDNNWHDLTIVATVDVEKGVYEVTQIGADGITVDVNMPMVSVAKPGWSTSFQVYLETHNMNPNCGSANITYGESQWRDVVLEYASTQP